MFQVLLPTSQIKIGGKLVKGFMSYDQTYGQTEITEFTPLNERIKLGNYPLRL